MLFRRLSEKSAIPHEEITLSQPDTESVVGSAGTHFAISCAPEEKVLVEMGKESPAGVPEQVDILFLKDRPRKMTGGTDFV